MNDVVTLAEEISEIIIERETNENFRNRVKKSSFNDDFSEDAFQEAIEQLITNYEEEEEEEVSEDVRLTLKAFLEDYFSSVLEAKVYYD